MVHQCARNQHSADRLRKQGCSRHAEHAKAQSKHQRKVEHDIDNAADDQIIQRPPGIADRTQNCGTHIVNQHKRQPGKINPHIHHRIVHQLLRRVHLRKQHRRQHHASQSDQYAEQNGKRISGMQRLLQLLPLLRSKILRNNNRCPGSQSGKKPDHQIDDLAGGTAHAGQCFFSRKPAHHNGIHRVI